jgi:hypothetical protein
MLHPQISHDRTVKFRGSRLVLNQHFSMSPCECCGDLTVDGPLCRDCLNRSYQHHDGDPYDDIGGGD